MHSPRFFQELIEEEIKKIVLSNNPPELYDPIRYMLTLGGKRMRPAALLMSNELCGGNPFSITGPALGIEMFHNFTLLHDDIMDKAPLRRAQPTVHTRWNPDIAILSGDTMFVQSCQHMMQVEDKYLREVLELFHKTAIEVCEGQQLDMNFESRNDVSIPEYINMIALKTAVLLGASLHIGALLSGTTAENARLLYNFGKDLGIAFQLHDDILDVYADAGKFGKQVGGDIIANKKTFLLLTALELADSINKAELNRWLSLKDFDPVEKVAAVKRIYESLNVRQRAEQEMEKFYLSAMRSFDLVDADKEKKNVLRQWALQLMQRES
ncbi:MAG TPA: polyprenyl synthetase family protein [Bacteroidia bacterium]|nr:polyprenyl synthetase family protein [Bacteroidia bacterium]HNP98131.1 polyprenyl synthetase family protein [Bacteroidia bacterium]